jgi:hypothetical protein
MPDRIVVDNHPLLEPMDTPLTRWIDETVRQHSRQITKQRETYCRELLEARLPRRLRWLIDKPKLLKRVLRIAPWWRPTLTFVPLCHPAPIARSRSWATREARYWEREQRVSGKSIPSGGLVFTYTDVSGLPAEVYGPVA